MGIVTSGLVRHYRGAKAKGGTAPGDNGDAGTRGTWDDLTGTVDGTLSGYDYTSSSGWVGAGTVADPYALITNGDADYVDAGDISLAETKNFTYEAWVATTNTGSSKYIFAEAQMAGTTGALSHIRIDITTGYAKFGMYDDANSTGDGVLTNAAALHDGAWHHIVATCESSAGEMSLYVDGSLIQHDSHCSAGAFTITNSNISGRRRGAASTTGFLGSIAAVRVYSRPLTLAEVEQNFAAGVNGDVEVAAWPGMTVTRLLRG